MTVKQDADRLFTVANEMTDPRVAERVRQLARQLDTEEEGRAKSDTELAASDFGQGVARGMQQAGLPSDDVTVANIVRDLKARAADPKR
ncbi:MAG: hypothetical protein M3P06_10535 [Acidobacteriota bacterium]|nr:hypothetical protein [Acidobacteriota bacterium]